MTRKVTRASDVLDVQARLRDQATGQVQVAWCQRLMDWMVEQSGKWARVPGQVELPPLWYMTYPAMTAREYMKMVHGDLAEGQAFQADAAAVRAVSGMYRSARSEVREMRQADMPSERGFMWLDEPLAVQGICIRAVSWGRQDLELPDGDVLPGARLTFWSRAVDMGESREAALRWLRRNGGEGGLIVSHMTYVPFDKHLHGDREDSEYPPMWLQCMWAFMGTVLAQESTPLVRPRSAARMATAGRPDPGVRVIGVRKALHHPSSRGEATGTAPDWSCRWLVNGHYRHRDEAADGHRAHRAEKSSGPCSRCGEPCYRVKPYVKGPDGKPLRLPAAPVYRVSA